MTPETSTTLLRDIASSAENARWGEFCARYEPMMRGYLREHFPYVEADGKSFMIRPSFNYIEGQMDGSAVQAMGWGIMEEQFMKGGRMENPSFHGFLIPTTLDVPDHDSYIVECPNELGPFGAKGIGEPGIIPGAPAIRNAFLDATGVRMNTIPLTPVRVTEALEGMKF